MSDQKIYTDKRGRCWVRDVDGTHGWWGGPDDVGYGFVPWSCEEADGRVTAEDGERSQDGQRMFYRFSLAPDKRPDAAESEAPDQRVIREIATWIAAIGGMVNADRLAKQIARWPRSSTCAARSGATDTDEVDVYEAAARIVRATVGRDLTVEDAERLRAMTDAGMFRAAWER